MEFKIVVNSNYKGPIDQYINNLRDVNKVLPDGSEMHILRNADGVDIIFYAAGYEPELYAKLKSHASYVIGMIPVPHGAQVTGMF